MKIPRRDFGGIGRPVFTFARFSPFGSLLITTAMGEVLEVVLF